MAQYTYKCPCGASATSESALCTHPPEWDVLMGRPAEPMPAAILQAFRADATPEAVRVAIFAIQRAGAILDTSVVEMWAAELISVLVARYLTTQPGAHEALLRLRARTINGSLDSL